MTGITQKGCAQKRHRDIGADRQALSVFQLMVLSGKAGEIGKKLTGIKAYAGCILRGEMRIHAFLTNPRTASAFAAARKAEARCRLTTAHPGTMLRRHL